MADENKPAEVEDNAEQKNDSQTKPELDPIIRLKRFLYTSDPSNFFVTGAAEKHGCFTVERVKCIAEILSSENPEKFMNIIEIVSGENLIPRRETLFFAISAALKNDNLKNNIRNAIYTTALSIIKSEQELFMLVKFICNKPDGRKMPSGLQKVVKSYYSKKEPITLAKDVTMHKGFYGWSHKDIIKLVHFKSKETSVLKLIISNILFGINKCKDLEILKNNSEAQEIMDYFTKAHELKTSQDENYVAENFTKLNFSFSQIPSTLNKSRTIWEVLVPTLSIQEIVAFLPRMHRSGLLRQDSNIQKLVLDILKDENKIRASGVHPTELFIGLRNFEKGGKPKDPHLIKYLESIEEIKKEADSNYIKKEIVPNEPIKGSPISSVLYKAVMTSFDNVQPTGKSIMITIDASARMNDNKCLTTKNVTCLEAAAVLALSLLKAEKRAFLAVFNKKSVQTLAVERNINVYSFIKKLQESTDSEFVVPHAPIEWALHKKKQVDIFINMINCVEFSTLPKESRHKKVEEPLKAYSKEISTNPKFISCHFGTHRNNIAQGILDGLDINGFDKNIHKLINAFIKNSFQ